MSDDKPREERRHPDRLHMRVTGYAPPHLVEAIAARLRRVCSRCSPEEFRALVQRMAHIEWKYDQRIHPDSLGRNRDRE